MHRELTPYLAEFAGAWEVPAKLSATPGLPSSSIAPSTTVAPSTVVVPPTRTATTGELPAGATYAGTIGRPTVSAEIRPWVSTVDGWRREMEEGAAELARIRTEIATRKRSGTVRRAETWFRRGDVHLTPNYETREYPAPRDGVCDMGQFVWVDLWMRAQALLRKFAALPPTGTPGLAVFQWANNVRETRKLMYETLNLRSEFFFLASSQPPNLTLGQVFDRGLATDAERGGAYTMPATPGGFLVAMNNAPQPRGGYAELLGGNLRMRPMLRWDVNSYQESGGRPVAGPRIAQIVAGASAGRLGDALGFSTIDPLGPFAQPPGVYGADVNPYNDAAWVTRELAWLWTRPETESPYRRTRFVAKAGTDPRRWRVVDAHTDIAAWVRNVYDYAAYFGNPAFSAGEVLLRTSGFYINSYLDYAARVGIVPQQDVAAAQTQADQIAAQAQAQLRAAIYTTAGITSGILTAALSVIPGIGTALGAVLGAIISGLTAIMVETGNAALPGAFFSPVLPLYERMYAGACRDAGWITPTPTTPAPTATPPSPPPIVTPDGTGADTETAKGAGGIIFGLGALWLAYQLLKR